MTKEREGNKGEDEDGEWNWWKVYEKQWYQQTMALTNYLPNQPNPHDSIHLHNRNPT